MSPWGDGRLSVGDERRGWRLTDEIPQEEVMGKNWLTR
jgi:hypothetical protein